MGEDRKIDPVYPAFLSGADRDQVYDKLKESIRNGSAGATYSLKVYFYNIQRGYQTNGNNISAKGLWESYIAAPNTDSVASENGSYVSRVDAACGVQYKAVTVQPLIYAILTKNIAQNISEMVKEYGLNLTAMRQQLHARTVVRAGHCTYWAARAQPAGEATVTLGVQVRSSPIYQAVICNNIEALEALLFNGPGRTVTGDVRYIKTCTEESPAEEASAGAHLMYDPNERSAQYLLGSVSISREDMLGFGGPEFEGTNQQKHSDFPTSGKEFGKTAEELFLKNSAGVPSWESLACEWTLDEKTVMLTPFELAFEKYLPAHMEALLWAPAVLATESLRLSSSANVIFPSRLAQMRNLTSLTVYVTSAVAAAVPSVIFELSALRRLVLAGCTYTEIPDEIAQLTLLEELDVSSMLLASVPVITLGKLRRLTSVDCSGMKLISPPAEIVKQGPAAVAQYILALGDGAEKNHDVLLMLIGDGEAGKTSMLQALKDLDTHRAGTIGVDERTVGIDISSFQPDPQRPLRFFAWDFGGQGIYAIMQQLFVSRRALYPLLWRVRQSIDLSNIDASIKCDVCRKQLVARPGEKQEPAYRVKCQGLCHSRCVSYDELISSWTERLQFRVPGVSMVLIATHIDCATPEEVEEQCAAVERVVAKILARQSLTMEGIAPLRVYNNGRSLRINNMTGEGVAELRRKLCEIAEGLDFYGEVIPSSYVRLRQRLREMQRHDEASWRTWLPYDEYTRIAAECGLADTTTLQLATRFLHDVGELRYYALSSEASESAAEGAEAAHDSDGEEADASSAPESGNSHAVTSSAELLAATVFPNPFWVVDVLRGLIRHDHSPVLALIKKDASLSTADKRTLRRRVYRLMQRGILHESLLRFVWAGVAGMSDSDAANADEFARLIALMKAFNILMDKPGAVKGREWIVPTLAAGKHARTMESDAFVDDSLPFVCRIVYDALPPYFDMILVAHIMNRRLANSVDFIEGTIASVFSTSNLFR
jgi:GTPase SAR1 family protein